MNKFSKVEPKHVIFVIALLLILNSFDAIFTLYVMDKYAVPELSGLVAATMKQGTFLLIKIGIPLLIGLFLLKDVKKFTIDQRLQMFAIGKLGILFYTEINFFNIWYIFHRFGGL